MKRHLRLYIAALTVCMLAACSGKKEKGPETHEKIILVKVIEISASQVANGRNYVGTVEESVGISLSFSGTGTVEQVLVTEGQKVAKGQLLATLNTATMQNSYDAALAKLAQAQDAYDRLVIVHQNGSLPDIKFAEVEAGLQQAKSMAAITKKSLDDCKMYAPRNGVIAARNVEAGSSAMPGVAAFKLVSVDKVNVKISVPENEIGSTSEGQEARVEVPALNGEIFTGKVNIKGVTANQISHTYDVKIGIANPQAKLMPGMVCKVETWRAASLQPALVVPNRAIQISTDGKRFIWLADGNAAHRQFVKTGDLTDNGIIVAEGLSAGDKLIVEGFQKISEGTKIKVEP